MTVENDDIIKHPAGFKLEHGYLEYGREKRGYADIWTPEDRLIARIESGGDYRIIFNTGGNKPTELQVMDDFEDTVKNLDSTEEEGDYFLNQNRYIGQEGALDDLERPETLTAHQENSRKIWREESGGIEKIIGASYNYMEFKGEKKRELVLESSKVVEKAAQKNGEEAISSLNPSDDWDEEIRCLGGIMSIEDFMDYDTSELDGSLPQTKPVLEILEAGFSKAEERYLMARNEVPHRNRHTFL